MSTTRYENRSVIVRRYHPYHCSRLPYFLWTPQQNLSHHRVRCSEPLLGLVGLGRTPAQHRVAHLAIAPVVNSSKMTVSAPWTWMVRSRARCRRPCFILPERTTALETGRLGLKVVVKPQQSDLLSYSLETLLGLTPHIQKPCSDHKPAHRFSFEEVP